MSKDSAFPTEEMLRVGPYAGLKSIQHDGLSKRELIAAMAMQGILSNSDGMKNIADRFKVPEDVVAKLAILNADTLLAQLAKEAK